MSRSESPSSTGTGFSDGGADVGVEADGCLTAPCRSLTRLTAR